MNFIDLFCGAGGLSLGFTRAGWACAAAVDHWDDAVKTYRENFHHQTLFNCDIADFDPTEFSNVDWVIGGPPCQGFSTVGKRDFDDPRNQLVRQFARIVRATRPNGFLIENVVGLRDMDFVEKVVELFEGLDYSVDVAVLRSADFGVPQLRHRIFFVGNRLGLSFEFPQPSHSADEHVTVWDAIGDLPLIRAGEAATSYDKKPFTGFQRLLRKNSKSLQGHVASAHPKRLVEAISYIPDGGNRLSIPKRLQPRSGFHNSYSRLHSGSPAVAVTQNMGKPSGTRCIHPFQDRGLTAREGARLQAFPDTFHFEGGITSQRLQIANAVSPLLAEALALALAAPQNWTSRKSTPVQQKLISLLQAS